MSTLRIVGLGPVWWSTSRQIATRLAAPCYDVNGYYRTLGIPWPYTHASIRDLRKAYLARGGPDDARMTQAFVTFLNPVQKAIYDATPLGQKYLDPEERVRRKVESLRLSQQLRAQGMSVEDALATGRYEVVDNADKASDDDSNPARESTPYPYSIFLSDAEDYDLGVLARWQEHLLDAVQEVGAGPGRMALGVTRGEGDWVLGDSRGVTVCLFDRYKYPSHGVAVQVVHSYLSL